MAKATRVSLEARLLDNNGASLAYYSPAHFDEKYSQPNFKIQGHLNYLEKSIYHYLRKVIFSWIYI